MDGNDHDPEDTVIVATQQRMLKRRSEPLVIPAADRMPPDVPSVSSDLFARLDIAQPPQ
jgi:hypothetical protein